ncbi:MAG: RsmF rRNA methyltransferase first C-terminal domain-containing protein [Clostridia bacterium]|nr:RsmF rRNA methyltransferase first C-terminal domain-containing protein [Clostridia bacterium]
MWSLLYYEKSLDVFMNERFLQRMKAMLGAEYPDFEQALSLPSIKALRVNTLKIEKDQLMQIFPYPLQQNPLCNEGFILPQRDISYGNTPQHHAGLFYMQEPSASAAVSALKGRIGKRVLDLCAAPGGKSTQLAAYMNNEGILICNETVQQRAKILVGNLERMGVRNAAVTSMRPDELAALLPGYFDTVIVDAPCSGEGMLRKEEAAVQDWSEELVQTCASRQREILKSADKLLCEGGILLYSTCTLNTEENEENIAFMMRELGYITLPPPDQLRAVCRPGIQLEDALRIFPHDGMGEGHFVCVLQKTTQEKSSKLRLLCPFIPPKKDQRQAFTELFEQLSSEQIRGEVGVFSDAIYLYNPNLPLVKGLHLLRAGVHSASILQNRLEPSHGLIAALKKEGLKRKADFSFDSPEVTAYLRGEVIPYDADFKGFGLIIVSGYPLGLVKATGGILKNHYPKGLRALK